MTSAKQQAKRQEIIAAAQRVILRGGPAQCTTREVARESGLNQGLIYYYFDTIEEIVDAAMAAFADDLVAAIERTRDQQGDPEARYLALFDNYFGVFAEQPGLATAWFEYWIICTRTERTEKLARVRDTVIEHLTEVLSETGGNDVEVRARVAMSFILGVLIRSWARPQDLEGIRPEIERLAYAVLDTPAATRQRAE